MNKLTKEAILNQPLPLNDLLENSLYYPASGFDGDIVKHASKNIQSFIFCNYAISEKELLSQLNTFRGYSIVGNRSLKKEELIPSGWTMNTPPSFNPAVYLKHSQNIKESFGHWAVYERLENFDESPGPKRFSLLYIGGEGVATYQALYWTNQKTAKALAIVQPGTGFGHNWTDFRKEEDALGWVVLNNQHGTPDTIYYGGIGSGYDDLNWIDYQIQESIEPYYGGLRPSGKATVWKKK